MKRASAGQRFGKYRLLERLGLGGTAEVWKAELSGPMGFQRTVVLKRLLPELVADPASVSLLVAEAKLSARLHHPAIVQVLELEQIDGEWVLSLEHVDGGDLRRLLRAQSELGPPDPGLGAYVVREVCRALAYAHALTDENGVPSRIIHRDVSPSNVMLSSSGAVKLVDFGLAKALGGGEGTRTGSFKGNLAYMAPEQLAGQPLDGRTDLYAAGVVLHEALTARRLFKASDLGGMSALRSMRIEPPSRANPRVPPELDALCARALAFAPGDRYGSAEEMAGALEEIVHRVGFGPADLAKLVRARPIVSSPAPLPDDAARVTATHGPTARPPRTLRWIAAGVGLALLASLAWWIAQPPVTSAPAPLSPPIAQPIPVAAPATPPPSPQPVVAAPVRAPMRTATPHHEPAKSAPDLVKGKLVDPFAPKKQP